MARKTYVEPPMKFNIGMKKYDVDLPLKKQIKNTHVPSDNEIRNFILTLIAILILFFIRLFFQTFKYI